MDIFHNRAVVSNCLGHYTVYYITLHILAIQMVNFAKTRTQLSNHFIELLRWTIILDFFLICYSIFMTAKMISKLCKFLVFIMHLIDAMTHTPLAILVFIVY